MDEHDTSGGTVVWVSTWLVGLAVLTTTLAPFALPILILTAVFALPLLLPVIPVALAAGAWFGARALVRAARPSDRTPRPAVPRHRRFHARRLGTR